MEVVEASAIRPDSEQSQTNAGVDMLPRPCSMPSFDRKTELARKRILQTLPSKPSVRRGLVSIYLFGIVNNRLANLTFVDKKEDVNSVVKVNMSDALCFKRSKWFLRW